MQNLRPSNDTVIFQRPSCGANIAVASRFIAGTGPVVTPAHDAIVSEVALLGSSDHGHVTWLLLAAFFFLGPIALRIKHLFWWSFFRELVNLTVNLLHFHLDAQQSRVKMLQRHHRPRRTVPSVRGWHAGPSGSARRQHCRRVGRSCRVYHWRQTVVPAERSLTQPGRVGGTDLNSTQLKSVLEWTPVLKYSYMLMTQKYMKLFVIRVIGRNCRQYWIW